jgi:hypothetical protein
LGIGDGTASTAIGWAALSERDDRRVRRFSVAEGGRFEAFHDVLFAQRDSIGTKPWSRFAVDAGLSDTSAFERCLQSAPEREAVARDTGYAGEAQLTSYVGRALGQ